MEISNLPNKEFQEMVLIMLTELGKRIEEHSENFNKDLKNIKKEPIKDKNIMTEIKTTL